MTYDCLSAMEGSWPDRDDFVRAMAEAELEHWSRVVGEHWSGPPSGLIQDGFRRLGRHLIPPTRHDSGGQ
jgi:hypothetical protein